MKDSHLINFSLFCKRTKFSLYSFLKSRPEINFDELCDYLRSKSVMPVSKEIYQEYINKINLEKTPVIEHVVEEKIQEKVAVKKTVKRKRRKKSDEQS